MDEMGDFHEQDKIKNFVFGEINLTGNNVAELKEK
jgi:hypothetical protein